jgi:hypothetical protein
VEWGITPPAYAMDSLREQGLLPPNAQGPIADTDPEDLEDLR